MATRFRILDEAEGEGIEILPIEGDLYPVWGTQLHAGDRTDETL
ncbi:MAG: hypothetical protein VX656_16775 [Candidatus Latescibacterota bacterium]|nr:hypothetical protein [Candidatus Latescibacterota bacterium]